LRYVCLLKVTGGVKNSYFLSYSRLYAPRDCVKDDDNNTDMISEDVDLSRIPKCGVGDKLFWGGDTEYKQGLF